MIMLGRRGPPIEALWTDGSRARVRAVHALHNTPKHDVLSAQLISLAYF